MCKLAGRVRLALPVLFFFGGPMKPYRFALVLVAAAALLLMRGIAPLGTDKPSSAWAGGEKEGKKDVKVKDKKKKLTVTFHYPGSSPVPGGGYFYAWGELAPGYEITGGKVEPKGGGSTVTGNVVHTSSTHWGCRFIVTNPKMSQTYVITVNYKYDGMEFPATREFTFE